MVVLYDTGYAMVSASFQNLYSKKLLKKKAQFHHTRADC